MECRNPDAVRDQILEVRDLCYSYKAENGTLTPVIRNVSLSVQRGSFVAILGHNGSGKSTFAKLLNMILTPQSGSLRIDGTETLREDITEEEIFALRRKIGMVFQNPDNQMVATIVEEDVAFGPENIGIPPEEIRQRVDSALRAVNMTEFAKHSPSQLSGGQKQRIAIAGILALLPDCIVFDEPTSMLDPAGRAEVMDTILKLNREKGITVLLITHYMDEAVQADRVLVMDHGSFILDGTPREVFSQVEKIKEVGLDVPQVTELMYRLHKDAHLEVPYDILHSREAVDALKLLYAKENGGSALG
ncbi:MAG: energy-coupling factor transporter ATPase [Clostridia bacterium]|nr:energy-coupling factor transporter ATPase [Clostridia bacterium]